MPSSCPNPRCREDLIKMMNEKIREIRACLNNKVSTKMLVSVFVVVLSAIGIVSGISYTAYSRGQDEKQKAITECGKVTQKLNTNMAVVQRDLETIKAQLEKQGMSQDKILDILMDIKREGETRTHNNTPR